MAERKSVDQLGIGEEFEPYQFLVTPEFNHQYLEAVDDHHRRYLEETELGPPIVHPALFLNYCSITKSPSFYLPPGMAAVVAKDEIEYLNPGRVGKSFRVSWNVVDTYTKRGRIYQVTEISVVDEDGIRIMRRRMNCTYMAARE
jgi:hypothetical protein